jgi:Flp pilus assembly protein TadG
MSGNMRFTSTNRAAHLVPRLQSARAVEGQRAQTLVFFALSLTAIILLCGFAIDSGLLYLAKARISRAVDGAALAAVGNFHQSDVPATNRADVATIIRNFATANFRDLGNINETAPEVQVNSTTYTYNFFNPQAPVKDTNGAYREFVQVTLTIGAGGQIVSAQANARCPVNTFFIGIFGHLTDLKVSSGAVASRNPRLIMVVADRSGSMLTPPASGNPGCVGLAPAIVTFLNFFDTSSDYIGLVSFASNARLEMPLTTNFLYAATNDLYEAYDITVNSEAYGGQSSWYVPGPDPEHNQANYYTQGVRRFRFGGQTAADEGIRLALEQMMANSGWSNPDVVKYMVIFTDGAWNTTRTLVAAPGYTNVVNGFASGEISIGTNQAVTDPVTGQVTNTVYTYTQVPTLTPWLNYWDAVGNTTNNAADHQFDIIQSFGTSNDDIAAEGNSYQSTPLVGAPHTYTTNTYLGPYTVSGNTVPVFSTNLSVWVTPGSVDYIYRATNNPAGALSTHETIVSEMDNPTKTVNINLASGDSNVLVVPGYLVDGIIYDGLDLAFQGVPSPATDVYLRQDNFVTPWMWQDADAILPPYDGSGSGPNPTGAFQTVLEAQKGQAPRQRMLLFRNYMNLLSGFYIFRPDDPLGTGIEPLTGANRPLNTVGAYYPSAAFYWPFDLVGLDQYPTFALINPATADPSSNGKSRAIAYSINMLSSNAAPEWSGELFYNGQNAALSGATSASNLMTSKAAWQTGMPSWISTYFDHPGITETDSAHNTAQLPTVQVWRTTTFNGTNMVAATGGDVTGLSPKDSLNYTGGYVQDSAGNIYRNAMAWSGRPTHYYDFSHSTWVSIATNHIKNVQMLPLGNWKASEYCWHARAAGVTIYTVGYGGAVSDSEQSYLATLANATNTTAGGGSNFLPQNYNTQQPIGAEFYATNASEIGVDFSNVATAINAALTQ